MKCIYCHSKIDLVNQLDNNFKCGLIPKAIVSKEKLIRNKENLLVCMDCIDDHNELIENYC